MSSCNQSRRFSLASEFQHKIVCLVDLQGVRVLEVLRLMHWNSDVLGDRTNRLANLRTFHPDDWKTERNGSLIFSPTSFTPKCAHSFPGRCHAHRAGALNTGRATQITPLT
jgi:hypothetical protein